MKIRNILMKALLASVLTVSQNLLFLSDSNQAKAQGTSRPRPYIVLVNGYQNCCTWGRDNKRRATPNILDKVVGKLPPNTEIRYVPYSNFVNSGTSGNSSTDEQFLRDGADFINKLDRNRPLILIGHSFGGDSVIKLLSRINRRIQFVAVIDPVTTAGFRKPLTRSLGVGGNVDYFFNRWQENVPFPNDFRTNGKIISCIASRCDQEAQNLVRSEDGSTKTIECRWDEVTCPGFVAPNPFIGRKGKKGTKQVRTGHQDLPKDAYVQRVLGDRIVRSLASFRPPSNTPTVKNNACVTVDSKKGWQQFDLGSTFTKVASISGSWSVDTRNYSTVGALGHTGSDAERLAPYNQYKFDQDFSFGALLVDIPNQGYINVQQPQQLPQPIGQTAIRINDADNALGDNGGSLKVCFGK